MDLKQFSNEGGIKIYCAGCGKLIEELSLSNYVLNKVHYDPGTGKFYHDFRCEKMDIENLGKKTKLLDAGDLEKILEELKLKNSDHTKDF